MNQEAKIAYIQAQTVCALAEIEGMKAENKIRKDRGHSLAYDSEAFFKIPEKYGIHHNAIVSYLND